MCVAVGRISYSRHVPSSYCDISRGSTKTPSFGAWHKLICDARSITIARYPQVVASVENRVLQGCPMLDGRERKFGKASMMGGFLFFRYLQTDKSDLLDFRAADNKWPVNWNRTCGGVSATCSDVRRNCRKNLRPQKQTCTSKDGG